MEFNADVYVTLSNTKEKEVEVSIDVETLNECEDTKEKIDYIIEETKKQNSNISKVNFGKTELEELEKEIDDVLDTSDMHPNENYGEFMEHENFE